MYIKQIINSNLMCSETSTKLKKCNCINIGFVKNDGEDDETQLTIKNNPLTKKGEAELSDLFSTLTKELDTKDDKVTYVTVVATAKTTAKLEANGY